MSDSCLHHMWGDDDGLTCTREPGHPPGHSYEGTSVPHTGTPEGSDQ